MLDTYVLNRINLWASWHMRKFDNGGGYPKKSAFVREVTGGFWTPDMDSNCIEMDQAICALLPERKEVIMKAYTELGTKEAKARRCGCCVRTFDARLSMAYRDLLGYLNDLAAGVALPQHRLELIA